MERQDVDGVATREIDRLHKRIDDFFIVLIIFQFAAVAILLFVLASRIV